jgi:chromosomal replication initiation ATPase DnaA
MARQLRLSLRRPAAYSRQDFVEGPSNARAVAALDAWPAWHGGALALAGPEGCGKTHLARAWAEACGAVILGREAPDLAAADGRPVLLEDVDRGAPEEALFHLINMAARPGGGLLVTARTPPAAWPAALPDLRSRLNALPLALIEDPDDRVLEAVLRKLFAERAIRPKDDVYPYLIRRMERSVPRAREIVERLDEAADEAARPISRALARQVLEDDNANLDLFE